MKSNINLINEIVFELYILKQNKNSNGVWKIHFWEFFVSIVASIYQWI